MYTLDDVAKLIGVSRHKLWDAIRSGRLTLPGKEPGRHRTLKDADVAVARAFFRRAACGRLTYSVRQMAEMVGVAPHRIVYAIYRGRLTLPGRVPGRAAGYTMEDVAICREYFEAMADLDRFMV